MSCGSDIDAVAASLLASAIVFVTGGCASTSADIPCPEPPEPEVIIEEAYRCPDPGEFPQVTVPSASIFPESGTAEQIKAWLVHMKETLTARETIFRDAIAARDRVLDEYRRHQ